jgi:hypothetical protein
MPRPRNDAHPSPRCRGSHAERSRRRRACTASGRAPPCAGRSPPTQECDGSRDGAACPVPPERSPVTPGQPARNTRSLPSRP